MMALVQEAEGGIVTDVGLVPNKADAPLLVPAAPPRTSFARRGPRVAPHQGLRPRAPDRGDRPRLLLG